ncbi:MAG TPA: hypothetical protein VHD81_01135 [Mycobacteriales bacterium]|nr:hypothetical protein [Mycobacteriales bacterium]
MRWLLAAGAAAVLAVPTAPAVAAADSAAGSPAPAAVWGAVQHVDTATGGRLTAISCPTKRVCVAIDRDGVALVERDGKWSKPVVVVEHRQHLQGLSCPTATFCMAVDHNGGWYRWNGHKWATGAPKLQAGHGPARHVATRLSVACLSPTSCFAISGPSGNGFRWDGRRWSAGPSIPERYPGVRALSCPSASACYVAGESSVGGSKRDGAIYYLHDGRWSTSREHGVFIDLWCMAPSHCLAEDSDGTFYAVSGAKVARTTRPPIDPADMSCPTPTYCVAVGAEGETSTFDGSAWSTPTPKVYKDYTAPFTSISCAAVGHCRAVGYEGHGARLAAAGLTDVRRIERESGGITSISCATPTFCVAVDVSGQAVEWDGSTWQRPVRIDTTNYGLSDVSCATPSFCLAVDRVGRAYRYDGSSWTAPQTVMQANYAGSVVSCPTATFCMLVSDENQSVTYDHGVYGIPTYVPGDIGNYRDLSCPTTTFCEALLGGKMIPWSHGAWQKPQRLLHSRASQPTGVSCTSETYCVAVSEYTHVYDGTSWQLRTGRPATAVSCGSQSSCLAIATYVDGTRGPEGSTVLGSNNRFAFYKHHRPDAVSCVGRTCMVAFRDRKGTVQTVTLR